MKRKISIKFVGIDDWNRPVYKDVESSFHFGSTQTLFPDKNIAPTGSVEEINAYFKEHMYELEYFGRHFNCEPLGGLSDAIELVII